MAKRYYWKQKTRQGTKIGCTPTKSITQTQARAKAKRHGHEVELFDKIATRFYIETGGGSVCELVGDDGSEPQVIVHPSGKVERF